MCQYTVVLELLHDVVDFLIILLVVFLLTSAALEVLGPEFQVVHLVHGQQNKVQLITVFRIQFSVLIKRDRLNAEFQTFFNDDLSLVCLTHAVDLGEVFRIVDVGTGIHFVNRCPDAVATAPDDITFVPVFFDAVVDMIGKTDLIQTKFNGPPDLRIHCFSGVIREFTVNMIIRNHSCLLF